MREREGRGAMERGVREREGRGAMAREGSTED